MVRLQQYSQENNIKRYLYYYRINLLVDLSGVDPVTTSGAASHHVRESDIVLVSGRLSVALSSVVCACTVRPTIFPCSAVAIIGCITTFTSTSSAALIVVIVNTSTRVVCHHLLHHLLHLSQQPNFAKFGKFDNFPCFETK